MSPSDFIAQVGALAARRLPPRAAVALLAPLLAAFVAEPAHRRLPPQLRLLGADVRILLNRPEDGFHIVVVPWAGGSRSLIHDHAGATGAVAALAGATMETKYRATSAGTDLVRLERAGQLRLGGRVVTPLLPDDGLQLHEMAHAPGGPAATVHVYLQPLLTQDVYLPRADGLHQRQRRSVTVDVADAAHWWSPPNARANAAGADARVSAMAIAV